jgi:hypothetical protein
MMNHRLTILRSARKQLLSPIIVPRIPFVLPQCHLFSSARPLVHEQDGEEEWKQKEKKNALKQVPQKQQSSSVPPASTVVANNLVPATEIHLDKKNDLKTSSDTSSSPSELTYTGNATMPITTRLHIVTPGEDTPRGVWPIFRLMVSLWNAFSKKARICSSQEFVFWALRPAVKRRYHIKKLSYL